MELLVLSGDEVRMALPMADAIAGMKRAFAQLSAGRAEMPLRSRVDVSEQDGVVLVMPAFLAETADLAVKVVSVFPRNVSRSKPIIHALVVALDADTGQPVALLEGGTLTAIRTGAASGAATDVLARPDAEVVAIIGSGVQARTQLEAVCAVRQVSEVRVFSLQRAHAEVFAEEMAGRNGVPTRILVMDDANSAVSEADIVCAATTSSTPVFDGRFLKPGAHVNGVGSFSPQMQEVDVETVRRALVVVDARTAALAEAGDLIIPIQNGDIAPDHIHAELGEILNGDKPGRTSPEQITFFKSVGVAVQDAIAAHLAVQNGRLQNLGKKVTI